MLTLSRKCLLIISLFALFACSSSITSPKLKTDNAQTPHFTVQLLGINDFHGQIHPFKQKGGMSALAYHLLQAIESTSEHTFLLHGGDHIGASPAESALLQDEPSVEFLNLIQEHCSIYRLATCHVIGTAGNHEFDEGSDELLRVLHGGNHENGPFIQTPWKGALYETLSANVVDKTSQKLLLKPYSIHNVNNIPIGFIGITLDTTPELVVPGAVDNLTFNGQSSVVAHFVTELQSKGVESIVVIVHDGTEAQYYEGPTQENAAIPNDSSFAKFIKELPDAVDVVVSGHSHLFTNARVTNKNGKNILVTQAFSNGLAYSDISITIDPVTRDIVSSVASVVQTQTPFIKALPTNAQYTFDKIKNLITQATDYVTTYTQTVINVYSPSESEIPLGQFIADAHKYALKTDFAIMNDGGVRAELPIGEVTWGDFFAIQPFGNALVERRYSGHQLLKLITPEHYWSSGTFIDENGTFKLNENVIDINKSYTLGGNAYIMNSKGFSEGQLIRVYSRDIDETVSYVKSLPTPFNFKDIPKQ